MKGEKHNIDVVRNPFTRVIKKRELRALEETIDERRLAESAALETQENVIGWAKQAHHYDDERAKGAAQIVAAEATLSREEVEKDIARLRAELGMMAAKEEPKTLEEKLAPYKVEQHEEDTEGEQEQKAA